MDHLTLALMSSSEVRMLLGSHNVRWPTPAPTKCLPKTPKREELMSEGLWVKVRFRRWARGGGTNFNGKRNGRRKKNPQRRNTIKERNTQSEEQIRISFHRRCFSAEKVSFAQIPPWFAHSSAFSKGGFIQEWEDPFNQFWREFVRSSFCFLLHSPKEARSILVNLEVTFYSVVASCAWSPYLARSKSSSVTSASLHASSFWPP